MSDTQKQKFHRFDAVKARQGNDSESIKWGYAEHLRYTLGVDRYTAHTHDKYYALAMTIRDRIINQWIHTQQKHHDKDVKRVYYLSLEFLMGRALGNNIINMGLNDSVLKALSDLGLELEDIREAEVDAGLGNGGLGRLAACFLDSLASLEIPAFGYGLRYDFGIFRQAIENGYQVEHPDEWLRNGCPWEIERPDICFPVKFGGRVESINHQGRQQYLWIETQDVLGIAYDTPVVGYGGNTINTLRLWGARSAEDFNFDEFNEGDYVESVRQKVNAETLTKVLYPNDKLYLGKELRLKQQYLFVTCSLLDIIRRFKKSHRKWSDFPDMAAIQLNDTHPSLAVAELMRILLDEERLDWNEAWSITVRSLGYTNHTLMPEALEKWPVEMFQRFLPRHLMIIYEINQRFLQKVSGKFPGNSEILRNMSIIEESDHRQVRMAHLAIVGCHSTNGVAALHTELLKNRLVPDFARVFPDRFNNKTNGITQRRWLLKTNPQLSALISERIGKDWIMDMSQLKKMSAFADDKNFLSKLSEIKNNAKKVFAAFLNNEYGWKINTDSIFDFQVKRIHEYKRQLLNILHVIVLYIRLKKSIPKDFVPRTFFIGGKAAPGYAIAKLVIKLINNVSAVINPDTEINRLLNVYFLPNYRVSLAEKILPAAEISEQISTAGTEASGTGNMKFMCNGALTVGTLDGANIEMLEEVGKNNMFIFGLNAEEVEALRPHYNPWKYYESDQEIHEAIDLLFSGHFNFNEPDLFHPLRDILFEGGDYYMILADLRSYIETQEKIAALYRDKNAWNRMSLLNIASSGRFSSDRTIREYAREIWGAEAVHIDILSDPADVLEDAESAAQI
ncbi:MAG: glycogen/starch/alpha-glucan phosphorylase [Spirochaetales bacterium]|nr:glycogen/starch/alpha-glucan phosphorylase [Spirochaetales bacterium]